MSTTGTNRHLMMRRGNRIYPLTFDISTVLQESITNSIMGEGVYLGVDPALFSAPPLRYEETPNASGEGGTIRYFGYGTRDFVVPLKAIAQNAGMLDLSVRRFMHFVDPVNNTDPLEFVYESPLGERVTLSAELVGGQEIVRLAHQNAFMAEMNLMFRAVSPFWVGPPRTQEESSLTASHDPDLIDPAPSGLSVFGFGKTLDAGAYLDADAFDHLVDVEVGISSFSKDFSVSLPNGRWVTVQSGADGTSVRYISDPQDQRVETLQSGQWTDGGLPLEAADPRSRGPLVIRGGIDGGYDPSIGITAAENKPVTITYTPRYLTP